MVNRPTEANVAPIFLNDVDLWAQIAGESTTSRNFKQALTGAVLTPSAQTASLQTLSPKGSFSSIGTPSWVATLNYVQDWSSVDSMSNWLFDNDGKAADLWFSPKSGVGLAWKISTPRIIPGGIGGSGANTALAGTVTLGVTGKPSKLTMAELLTLFPTVP